MNLRYSTWLSLLQEVAVYEGGHPSPGRQEECVEGDVPGAGRQVRVEGARHQRLLPPVDALRLQADAARMSAQGASGAGGARVRVYRHLGAAIVARHPGVSEKMIECVRGISREDEQLFGDYLSSS